MHTSSASPRRRARHANHDRAAGPSLDSLPVDLLLEVTKTLGGADLLRCAAVSRGWRDALEPAFESRCVSRAREDRAWMFPETGSIDGGDTTLRASARWQRETRTRASRRGCTWREYFLDEFCVWCREAPNAPVRLVAMPLRPLWMVEALWRWYVVCGWSKLAHHGLIPTPLRSSAKALRQSRVTLCGRCLALDKAKDLTRRHGMTLTSPLDDEDSAREKRGWNHEPHTP